MWWMRIWVWCRDASFSISGWKLTWKYYSLPSFFSCFVFSQRTPTVPFSSIAPWSFLSPPMSGGGGRYRPVWVNTALHYCTFTWMHQQILLLFFYDTAVESLCSYKGNWLCVKTNKEGKRKLREVTTMQRLQLNTTSSINSSGTQLGGHGSKLTPPSIKWW